MLGPERDQTATKSALVELDRFLTNYPDSKYRSEVEKLRREVRDRLSESEYRVGVFSYRSRNYGGAIARFMGILKEDPQYTFRDAVYYYLAESYIKVSLTALGPGKDALVKDAVSYYEKLIAEFTNSDYLERAQRRLKELKR